MGNFPPGNFPYGNSREIPVSQEIPDLGNFPTSGISRVPVARENSRTKEIQISREFPEIQFPAREFPEKQFPGKASREIPEMITGNSREFQSTITLGNFRKGISRISGNFMAREFPVDQTTGNSHTSEYGNFPRYGKFPSHGKFPKLGNSRGPKISRPFPGKREFPGNFPPEASR